MWCVLGCVSTELTVYREWITYDQCISVFLLLWQKYPDKGNLKKGGSILTHTSRCLGHSREVTKQELQGAGLTASLWCRTREWWMLVLSECIGVLTPITDYPQATAQISPHSLDSSKAAPFLLENNFTPWTAEHWPCNLVILLQDTQPKESTSHIHQEAWARIFSA